MITILLAAALIQDGRFEVASVKANHSSQAPPELRDDPMRLIITNMPLKAILAKAYGIRDDQVSGGPGWLESDRFDILAKSERATTREEKQQMLRELLMDRFHLKVRLVAKELPGFELVVAKNGPKLKRAKEGEQSFRRFGEGRIVMQAATMEMFARFLSSRLSRTVTDRTGITGEYDINLEYTPENYQPKTPDPSHHEPPPPDPNGPNIFVAIQEHLGLKLESRKGPVETLVIEHGERPSAN